jgi:amino acid adenylation domain-containing protein
MTERLLPVSGIQRQFWLAQELQRETTAYHIATLWCIRGGLKLESLQVAFEELCQRHESLRTTFEERENTLSQVVHSNLAPEFCVEHCHVEVGGNHVLGELKRPFDLVRGPLVRVRVFAGSEDESVVAWTMHHIVCDLASKELMGEELSNLYRLHSRGEALSDLAPPAHQYHHFCSAEAEWLASEERAKAEQYFRGLSLDTVPPLALPTDRPRPTTQPYRGAVVPLQVTPELSQAIERLARQLNSKPFLVWLAAYALTLARFSGETQLTIGVPFTNRRNEARRGLVGCCVNNLPVRVSLSGEPSFVAVLRELRMTMLGLHRHQELPLDRIVAAVQPRREPSRAPLFQAGFTFEPPLHVDLEGVIVTTVKAHAAGAQLDLFLTLWPDAHCGFAGHIEYAIDVVSEKTVMRVGESLLGLLQWLSEDVDRCEAPVQFPLPASDRASLAKWNATAVTYDVPHTLPALFVAQVRKTPEQEAVRCGDRSWTYRELYQRACGLARTLRESGLVAGDRVGLFFERSLEMVLGIYATLLADGVYVPIDPEYPWGRIEHMLDRARPRVVLLHKALRSRWSGAESLVHTILVNDHGMLAETPPRTTRPEDPAYVIFTSGSTGRPKGAINTHRGICNRLLWMQQAFPLRADDVVLQKTPYSFDVSTWEFFWPLIVGARLEVAPPGLHRDPAALLALIRKARVTTIHFVPSMLGALLDAAPALDCESLRRVICSGEALSTDLVRRFCLASDTELHNLYGPTEAAVDVSWWACRTNVARDPVPIGGPIANTQLHVLDSHLSPVPIGVSGELHIGGTQVGLGYVGDAVLSAERFIADPFASDRSARLYRTGDRARWNEDGTIAFLGRFDDQVKIRGLRIELGEIEAVLDQQPGVRQSVVVARRAATASGDAQLCAYVSTEDVRGLDVEPLKRALRRVLPAYMLPQHIVVLDALPLSANGKVDRKALPDPSPRAELAPTAPGNELERWLVAQTGDLIGQQLGVNQNFFDGGGSSLTAAQLIGRICSHLRQDVPLVKVFEHPTLSGLAAYLEELQGGMRAMDSVVDHAHARAEQRRQVVHQRVPRR